MDRDPICIQLIIPAPTGADVVRLTAPLRHGEVATIEEISVNSEQHDDVVVSAGLYDGNNYIWLQTIVCTASDRWFNFDLHFTQLTDYQIAIRFSGHDAGDTLRANIVGYIREPYTTP